VWQRALFIVNSSVKYSPKPWCFVVFFKWHVKCIMLEQDGGTENIKPEGSGGR